MIGLIYIVVLLTYGALLIGATVYGYLWAIRKGKKRSVALSWAVAGFMIVFLPVFWDAIPTWIAFKYYSEKEAGLTVFKTLEQWKKENPGVAETLEPYRMTRNDRRGEHIKLSNGGIRYPLNARFAYDVHTTFLFLSVKAQTYELVDVKTGEVLARYTAITSGNSGGIATGGPGWWKPWLVHGSPTRGGGAWWPLLEMAKNIRSKS